MDYMIVIEPLSDEDGGGYSAFCPDLPGCISDGDTVEEAAANILDAFNCWMEVQVERGVEIPLPGSSGVDASRQIESMARTIAKLNDDLEAANAKIASIERRPAPTKWQSRAVLMNVTASRNLQRAG